MSATTVKTTATKLEHNTRNAQKKAKNAAAAFLAAALLATLVVNFYMVSILPEGSDATASSHDMPSPLTADITDNTSWACVRKSSSDTGISNPDNKRNIKISDPFPQSKYKHNLHKQPHRRLMEKYYAHNAQRQHLQGRPGPKCELYPCTHQNGTFVETTAPMNWGYAGKFVQRDPGLKKQPMSRPGGKTWASGCVVSDKYKFAYVHVLKSGGTATKEFLRKGLCGQDDKDCNKVDPAILRPVLCRKVFASNVNYFTFSFVRNPYSRMYSMYSMMDGFPLAPSMKGKVTQRVSFEQFVLTDPTQRKNYTKMHKSHYYPQTEFVFSKQDCPSFDFLGRVEHFDQDMRTILEYLNATTLLEYLDSLGGSIHPSNTWGTTKKKSLGGDLRDVYVEERVRDKVVEDYERDFELLGYDWKEVPAD